MTIPIQRKSSIIAGFLDELRDLGEIWDDIGPGGRIEAKARMQDRIEGNWMTAAGPFTRRKQRKTKRIGEGNFPLGGGSCRRSEG